MKKCNCENCKNFVEVKKVVEDTLLPCPFCGETNVKFYRDDNSHYAFCSGCKASTKDFAVMVDRETVIKHWNRRVK